MVFVYSFLFLLSLLFSDTKNGKDLECALFISSKLLRSFSCVSFCQVLYCMVFILQNIIFMPNFSCTYISIIDLIYVNAPNKERFPLLCQFPIKNYNHFELSIFKFSAHLNGIANELNDAYMGGGDA